MLRNHPELRHHGHSVGTCLSVCHLPVSNQENETYSNADDAYKYRTSSELDAYPFWAGQAVYNGGGYVVELKGSKLDIARKLDSMKTHEWTDRWTRAIFIEFTVYNPNVNLFGVVTLVAEVLNSGGLATYHRIEPMNLLGYYHQSLAFQVACEIAFLLFVVFFIVKEARNVWRQRVQYFKQFWSWIELCIIIISLCSVGIYFHRSPRRVALHSFLCIYKLVLT